MMTCLITDGALSLLLSFLGYLLIPLALILGLEWSSRRKRSAAARLRLQLDSARRTSMTDSRMLLPRSQVKALITQQLGSTRRNSDGP
jgi:hypothetical protein